MAANGPKSHDDISQQHKYSLMEVFNISAFMVDLLRDAEIKEDILRTTDFNPELPEKIRRVLKPILSSWVDIETLKDNMQKVLIENNLQLDLKLGVHLLKDTLRKGDVLNTGDFKVAICRSLLELDLNVVLKNFPHYKNPKEDNGEGGKRFNFHGIDSVYAKRNLMCFIGQLTKIEQFYTAAIIHNCLYILKKIKQAKMEYQHVGLFIAPSLLAALQLTDCFNKGQVGYECAYMAEVLAAVIADPRFDHPYQASDYLPIGQEQFQRLYTEENTKKVKELMQKLTLGKETQKLADASFHNNSYLHTSPSWPSLRTELDSTSYPRSKSESSTPREGGGSFFSRLGFIMGSSSNLATKKGKEKDKDQGGETNSKGILRNGSYLVFGSPSFESVEIKEEKTLPQETMRQHLTKKLEVSELTTKLLAVAESENGEAPTASTSSTSRQKSVLNLVKHFEILGGERSESDTPPKPSAVAADRFREQILRTKSELKKKSLV